MRPMRFSILNLNPERLKVMKKIYIAMAVLGTVALVSCEREKSFNELSPIGKNGVAFAIGGGATRSTDAVSNVERGITLSLGSDDLGNGYYLEETIEELNPSPATKGSPAYTQNIGTIYSTMGVYSDAEGFGDAIFGVMDDAMTNNPNGGQGWRYNHDYLKNPWPEDDNTKVNFYLRMPATDNQVKNLSYNTTNKEVTFNYTAPSAGTAQNDLLFAYTSLSHKEHDSYLPQGAPVMMYHTLTGVKFRSGSNNSGGTKTIITQVKLSGLNDKGKCIFDATTGNVSWPADSLGKVSGTFYYLDYENAAWSATPGEDNTISYKKDSVDLSNNTFGDSWYSAAADKNLNNADGSLTFWLIPQTITKDVKLEVTFRVKTEDTPDGTEITHTIDLGEKLENVQWKAGQLRTYTLDPKDVDVEIFDHMNGFVKDSLHVTNTGNVDEYVRMMVVGNWYDGDGNILVGYKYSDTTDVNYKADLAKDPTTDVDEMIVPWFREDDTEGYDYGSYFDDTFKYGRPSGTNWVRGTGSYFYYTEPIGAGKQLSGTQSLFKSYSYPSDKVPVIYLPSTTSSVRTPAQGVHLVMEVVVQAIGTIGPDGNPYKDCWAAWSAATGENIKEKPFKD